MAFATVLYADDIRREEGNKMIVIGGYSSDMYIFDEKEKLPILAVCVNLYIHKDTNISSLTMKIFDDNRIYFQVSPIDDYPDTEPNGDDMVYLRVMFKISPYFAVAGARLRAEVALNGEIIPCNSLGIVKQHGEVDLGSVHR